jgi:hypothetical protein
MHMNAIRSKVNRDRYNIVDAPGGSCIFFTTAGYQYDVLKYLKVQRSKIYNFCTTFYFILNYL